MEEAFVSFCEKWYGSLRKIRNQPPKRKQAGAATTNFDVG